MESFADLKERTLCPFAKTAKVMFGPNWTEAGTFQDNVRHHAASLRTFARTAESQKYHGFVAQILAHRGLASFDNVKKTFFDYLTALSDFDSSCKSCMQQDLMSKSWQFEFAELRMFLNVFSSCYDELHSKYIDSDGYVYIFFQPEYSFDLCGPKPLSRATVEWIRRRFADAEMPYNGDQIDERIEALLYMFPENEADESVVWWE